MTADPSTLLINVLETALRHHGDSSKVANLLGDPTVRPRRRYTNSSLDTRDDSAVEEETSVDPDLDDEEVVQVEEETEVENFVSHGQRIKPDDLAVQLEITKTVKEAAIKCSTAPSLYSAATNPRYLTHSRGEAASRKDMTSHLNAYLWRRLDRQPSTPGEQFYLSDDDLDVGFDKMERDAQTAAQRQKPPPPCDDIEANDAYRNFFRTAPISLDMAQQLFTLVKQASTDPEDDSYIIPTVCTREEIDRDADLRRREAAHIRWRPPRIAMEADEAVIDPSNPRRVQLYLMTKTVMERPLDNEGINQALLEQGRYCKWCLTKLRKAIFNPLHPWDNAIFCFYTGYFFCADCHNRTTLATIPARAVQQWDMTPMPVSSPAYDFLNLHQEDPMIVINAVNPSLYESVKLLKAVHELRAEVVALNAIGINCKGYRDDFYGSSSSSSSGGGGGGGRGRSEAITTGTDNTTTTTTTTNSLETRSRGATLSELTALGIEGQRKGGAGAGGGGEIESFCVPRKYYYRTLDTECWSMADLEDIHAADPHNTMELYDADPYHEGHRHPLHRYQDVSPLIGFLLNARREFIRHIFMMCLNKCLLRGARACPGCLGQEGKQLALPAEVRHPPYVCSGCGCCYHISCWTRRSTEFGPVRKGIICPVCAADE